MKTSGVIKRVPLKFHKSLRLGLPRNVKSGLALAYTDPQGDCFFQALSIVLSNPSESVEHAFPQNFNHTGISTEMLRKIVANTVLYQNNTLANSTIVFWKELYTSAKTADSENIITEYNHISCIENDPLPLSSTARNKLRNAMMDKTVYWGEQYAISTLAAIFNLRIVIFNEHGQIAADVFSDMSKKKSNLPRRIVFLYLSTKHTHYDAILIAGKGSFLITEPIINDILK